MNLLSALKITKQMNVILQICFHVPKYQDFSPINLKNIVWNVEDQITILKSMTFSG